MYMKASVTSGYMLIDTVQKPWSNGNTYQYKSKYKVGVQPIYAESEVLTFRAKVLVRQREMFLSDSDLTKGLNLKR